MIAIRQAFSSSLRPITPLHVFHRLCVKLNHTNDLQTRLTIVSNLVEQVSEGEKFYISQKLKTLTPGDANERLVLTVAVLRELYEVKNREQQLVGGNGLKKGPSLIPGQNGNRRVEELATRLGSKISFLSRNVSQNVQKIGSELKVKSGQIINSRPGPNSRPGSSIGNVRI